MLMLVDFIAIAVYSVLLILIISSTIYDVTMRRKSLEPKKILVSFSLYTNVRDMLKLEEHPKNTIECFYGLRSLSALLVVSGHRIQRTERMLSLPSNTNLFEKFITGLLRSNGYAVDTFFLMAGILFTQSCIRSLEAKKLNLMKIYVKRYVRYVPTAAVLVLFYVTTFPFLIVDGPTVSHLENRARSCKRWWWACLLLIQNYTNTTDRCMSISWYLSVDFQLIVISPIFIFILWKFKYKALWLFVAILFSTQIGIFFVRYNDIVSFAHVYMHTHFRLAQFLIGIVLGYRMRDLGEKHPMANWSQLIAWIASIAIFVGIKIFQETHRNQHFADAFVEATHRIAFVGLVGWIIYVCHYLKSGGIINWFLSHPLWQPIAKISLSIYLIHNIYIVMSIVNTTDCMHLNTAWLIQIICGDFVISTFLGGILYLVIEAPSNAIIQCLMR